MVNVDELTDEERAELLRKLTGKEERELEAPVSVSAPRKNMAHISLSCGLEWDVDKDVFNDYELVTSIARADRDTEAALWILPKILGKDGEKALCDCLRNEEGRVPVDKALGTVREIIEQVKNAKK